MRYVGGKKSKDFRFFFFLIIIIKIGWKRKWEGMARNSCRWALVIMQKYLREWSDNVGW